jgi:hypothetical protein
MLDGHLEVDLAELGAAVRLQLGQREVPRPEQRLFELAHGSRFPSAEELDAIVQHCLGSAPVPREHFAQLHAIATRERSIRRANPAPATPEAQAAVARSRVGDPRSWVRLGVHAPITLLSDGQDVSGRVAAGELPAYVLREADRLQLRPALQAAQRGEGPPVRLIVISGEASAGKTRMAAEAALAILPDWILTVPRTTDDLTALCEADSPPRRVLVWLDEIQHLLTQAGASEALQRLLDLPVGPVVLLATLRSDAEYALRGTAGWRLLDRADHRILLHRRPPAGELRAELDRAGDLVAEQDDPWLREALAKIGDRYGIAEWLAAGPQLLRHLDGARTRDNDPVARMACALVDAAIDCYRAGYTSPIPEPLLLEAQRLYLRGYPRRGPGPQLGEAVTALPAALAWARTPVAGATGLLEHDRGCGDTAFDYLIGHASRPDAPPVDERIWPILARHLTPSTWRSVTIGAHRHGNHELAIRLARRQLDPEVLELVDDAQSLEYLADDGRRDAARGLVEVFARRGDRTGLERRANAGDELAAVRLADLPAQRGDGAGRQCRADAGDAHTAARLAERRDEAGLERRADAGDWRAAKLLAELLAQRNDQASLERRAASGDVYAAIGLADLLDERDDEAGLELRADAGDQFAADRWAARLDARGDEAELARRADAGDRDAALWLARRLAQRCDQIGLERRADAGDDIAKALLASLLFERGDEAELARQAEAGDEYAPFRLVDLLAERGDEAELERRADADDAHAAERLADLLAERGDEAGLERRADAGDWIAARQLAELLAIRGDEAGLRRRADAGDQEAAAWLARPRPPAP